jgi:hypothetical protein
MKKCKHCKIEKPLNEFTKNQRRLDGLEHGCKVCMTSLRKDRKAGINLPWFKIPLENPNYHRCCTCHLEKPYSGFSKSKNTKNGMHHECKVCILKRSFGKDLYLHRVLDCSNHPIYKGFKKRHELIQAISRRHLKRKNENYYNSSLGCTTKTFRAHIESKFQEGMSWSNYGGKHGWVLDHIKPLCRFDFSKEEEIKKAAHYTNTQPLWYHQNSAKTYLYTPEHPMGWSGFDVLLERQAYLAPISVI